MSKSKNLVQYVFIFAIIIAITIVGLWIYYDSLQQELEEQAHNTLDEIVSQQSFNFKSEVDAEMQSIVNIATMISYMNGDNEAILKSINEIANKTKFDFIIIADTQGNSINSNGVTADVSERLHYKRALKGETFVPEPVESLINGDMIIPFSTPIKEEGEIVGVLMGAYSANKFNELLLPSYEGNGYAFVVNNKGDIISKTQNEHMVTTSNNLFEPWEHNVEFYEFDNLETILTNVKQGKSGHTSYKIGDEKRITHYRSIGVNDWYIFVAVPEDVISESASNIINQTGYLATLIVICFSLFVIYIIYIQRRSARRELDNIRNLERIAYVDELTGARNYNKFTIDAQRILEERSDISHMIVKVDVENFKLINKTYGFEMGNHVLKVIADSLQSILLSDDEIFARVSVDEFVILHNFYGEETQLEIQKNFTNKFQENMGKDFNYKVKFKIGQYIIDKQQNTGVDIKELFEMANFAHRKAKQNSAIDAMFYDDSMSQEALYQKGIENKMQNALSNNEFIVYLQPKYLLKDETVGGAEALVRWLEQDGNMIYPNDFISIFEKNGFITKLDMYMLSKVCGIIKNWIDNDLIPTIISVNFSRLHLSNNKFIEDLCDIVDRYGIPRKYIEIEITETAIFENEKVLESVLFKLHSVGFTLSMDDFGSGYSSLGLLKNLPVDVIKVDRSFFVDQKNEQRTKTVVANVISMAKELSISVVAEGVEDKIYIDMLRKLGCDMVQGYYYAKPMPEEEFTERFIVKNNQD